MLCARCLGDVSDPPDLCVACQEPICSVCHDEYGHCGHPEVDRMNEELQASPPSAHGAIMERYLGSIEHPNVKPRRPN
jgi:hypothetical protein